MKVTTMTPKHPSAKQVMLSRLGMNRHRTMIFTRLPKEVVALVPFDGGREGERIWVWLSSTECAYCDGEVRSEEDVAATIIRGEWVHQPDAEVKVFG